MKFLKFALLPLGVLVLAGCSNSSTRPSADAPLTNERDSRKVADSYAATNTGKNQRDSDSDSSLLLPTDQLKGSDRDVEITRRIRLALTSTDGLSVNAQNIKIITLRGKTTLRGPVDSLSEKARVVSMAQQVAGPKAVRSQLEVTAE